MGKDFERRKDEQIKNFIHGLVSEFNEARNNPKSYILKIKSHMKFIKKHEGLTVYENTNNYPKIVLNKGILAFEDCIKHLEKNRKMPEMIYNDDITIRVPDKVEEMTDKLKIAELLIMKKKEMKTCYNGFSFHYDSGYLDSEICGILQIVDDTNTNTKRRNNILNIYHEFVGVSVGKMAANNRYVIYVTFAKSSVSND